MQSFHGELFCFPVQSAKAAPAALAALGKMHSVRFSVRFYNSKGFSEKKYLHFYKCKAQKEQQHWRHIAARAVKIHSVRFSVHTYTNL